MSDGGKGPEPRPYNKTKSDACPLWKKIEHRRLKPGKRFKKSYK